MKNMLYKAKGALALTLAVSICGAQCVPVFAAEALSAAQQGVQVTPVKELTEEEKAALQLPKLTAEEALAKAKKHSPDLREIQDTLDYLDDTLDDIDRSAGGTVTVPNVEYKKWVNDGWQKVVSAVYQAEQGKKQARIGEDLQNLGLEVSVKSYFTSIKSNEDTLSLTKKNAEIQKKLYEQWGLHFIHAGDEWYLLAGEPIPEEENYDGYIQLENGVGMLRLLEDEVAEELSKREGDDRHRHVTIATGKAAAPSLEKHMQKIREKYPNVQAEVITIINYFFGESITVSGLITGKDLMEQLEGRDLGDCLLLPCNMLRSGKNVFLDDVTVEEVEERLKTPVQIIDEPGSDLVKAVVEENQETIHRRRTMYEQADCSNCGPAERG